MKQMKSTYDRFIERLSPQELKEFEEEYQEFLRSELLLAKKAKLTFDNHV